MKNRSLITLVIIFSNLFFFGQKNTYHVPGTPCDGCVWADPNAGIQQNGAKILDGNGVIATSYTQSACGLDFVQVSNPLYKRGFSFQVGLNQPAAFAIAGIPVGAVIQKAFLYVGASGNLGLFNASITNPLSTTASFSMAQIGSHIDKCWGYSGTYNYRADVTSIIAGNGNYIISGIPVMPQVPPKDADGATLFIIYSDVSQNFTGSIVIGDGAQVAAPGTINSVLSGFNVCATPSVFTNFILISDLQKVLPTDIRLNSLANNFNLPTASQQVWNFISAPGAPPFVGQTTANYGASNTSDCFNLIMAGMYFRTSCSVCGILTIPNQTICAGTGAGFSVPNNSVLTNPTYSVNPGGLTNTTGLFNVSPLVTTTYTTYVTGLNASSTMATETQTFTVFVNPSPNASPTTTQTSCTNTVNAFNLGLTFVPALPVPSYTINWSTLPNGVTTSTQTSATGGIAPGIYTATITTAGGCSTTTSFSINSLPAISAFTFTPSGTSFTVTCAQPTVVINLNPASYNYTWTNGFSAPQNGPTGNFTSSNLGTWSVTGVNPVSGCSSTQTFVVTQNVSIPSSTVTPVAQNITCPVGSPATFTGITTSSLTNVTHSWYSPFSPGAATNGGTISIFNSSAPGTYTYCVTDNVSGCSTCKTVTITSSSGFPSFNITSPQQFTIGCGTTSLATINISSVTTNPVPGGPVSYTVLPPTYVGPTYTVGGSATYTANIPGQYTVIVHDNTNNCETKIPVSIIQNTFGPQVTAIANQQTLTCYVPSTLLQGTSTNTNVSFNWGFPGPPGNVPNDTLTVFTNTAAPNNTIVATYTLTVTDNINKCKSTQTITIYQNTAKPTAIITGGNFITCATETVNFTNASISNIPATFFPTLPVIGYSWSGPSPQQTFTNTSTYIAFTPAGVANQYTLVVKDLNNGCTAVTTKTLGDNRIYPNVGPATYTFDCGTVGANIFPVITGTTSGFSYYWTSLGSVTTASFSSFTNSMVTVNLAGSYAVSVTNTLNGCTNNAVITVVNGALTGDFSASSITGYAPLTVNFTNLTASSSTATGTSSITSVWSFGNGYSQVTTSSTISPVTTYSNAGTYTVTMYVSKGTCIDTVVKIINVELPSKLEVPNVFTPNGDGSNDVFFLKVTNVSEIHALIYDRWGNKVFESNSNTGNIEWDGKNMSGKEVSAGTYFYIITGTGKDGKDYSQKGNVSIYR
ncbi:MAG: gliding motility-associated C-terminal domain-containing protein [Bacteroidetes bacterium]|nr:gliding motility-associated C-terminal domain-containing protein [Bacteroidota bacterium]